LAYTRVGKGPRVTPLDGPTAAPRQVHPRQRNLRPVSVTDAQGQEAIIRSLITSSAERP